MVSHEDDESADERLYRVVVNHEEQYSIWAADLDVPAGWHEVGVTGSRADCLAHIDRVWTDITPLSVRRRLAGKGN